MPCKRIVASREERDDRLVRGRGHSGLAPWSPDCPSAKVSTRRSGGSAWKLDVLDAAASLQDLLAPPGNRLEVLRGDLLGFHSIRVNEQWRIVFRWVSGNAHEVRLADYH